MTEHCDNCGELCCGKLQIILRKGSEPKYFCNNCFGLFLPLKNSEIKKILKRNKYGVTC